MSSHWALAAAAVVVAVLLSRVRCADGDGKFEVVQTRWGEVWVSALAATPPVGWVGTEVEGGTCPVLSGIGDTDHHNLSLVIGIHRAHLALAQRTAYYACVDQSMPATEVVVVSGGVTAEEMGVLSQM